MTKILKVLAVFCASFVLIVACTQTEKPEATNQADTNANAKESKTPVEIVSGKDIYVTNCAKCHKEDGTGGKVEIEGKTLKADNLTTEKMKKEPDEEYFEYIEDGIPEEGMPAFKDILKESEIKEVVKYIREELQK
ncbi:MAG: cytochrome c [Pyrinomonadaceae bacterium]|nr:cytochrome c [Pyrinomonadaceae bacterium]